MRTLLLLAAAAAAAAADPQLPHLDGLAQPTYVAFDGAGRTLVAEKNGVVLSFDGFNGASRRVLLDLRGHVAS